MNEALVTFVRGFIAFITLLIYTRMLGKKQISQLDYFDYISGITIGSMAASLTTDITTRPWPHWVGLTTWVIIVFLLQFISLKSRPLSKYLDGEPTIVIMNGKIMEETLKKMRYRVTDLLMQLRQKNVFDISEVEFAVLETNGKLSVLKKSQYQPVTPKDLNLSTKYKGIGTELIYNGLIIDQNLKQVNLDRFWLEKELRKMGIKDPKEVMFAQIDSQGNLYVDTYRDDLKHLTDISDYNGPN